MPAEFLLFTRWRVEGNLDEVAAILADPLAFPDWWGDVYLSAEIVDPGDADGSGRTAAVTSRGWLPPRLSFTARLVEDQRPECWAVAVRGDVVGRAVWSLQQDGPMADIGHDWRVRLERPLLRLSSLVLGPLFVANHRWAMAKGEAGLAREVMRRRGRDHRSF